MAKEEQVQEEGAECENLDEVDYFVFLEYSKDELTQALVNCIKFEQKYLSKIKSEKKVIRTYHLKKRLYKNQMMNFILRLILLKQRSKKSNLNVNALKNWF